MTRAIEVVGADANNLADISLKIPLNAVTAVVGPSGSGKSSLVEDTIAREAAERMHRFLDVDLHGLRGEGAHAYVGALPPTLFAGQRAFRASSRTTVGTSTGFNRLLRRLFVRFSRPFADGVDAIVPEPSPKVFAEWLSRHLAGHAIVWAVPVVNEATTGAAAVRRLSEAGVVEVVVRSETDRGAQAEKGKRTALARFKPLRADVRHTIEAKIGEVRLGGASHKKLEALLERAWVAAPNGVLVELPDERNPDLQGAYTHALDTRIHRVHPDSPVVYAVANDHRLSFNAPEHFESGACPACRGVGRAAALDEGALILHPERSMHEGAFALWTPKNYKYVNIQHATIEGLRGRVGFDPDVPWRKLSAAARELVLNGSTEPVEDRDPKTHKRTSAAHAFPGFRRAIVERAARPSAAGSALLPYVHEGSCDECGGTRWSRQTRALRVGKWSVDRLLALPFADLAVLPDQSEHPKYVSPEARVLFTSLARMAASLVSVGLGHLSGERGMLEVSDGESRRVRLAGVLTSRLAGLLLVLDEPARGLHEEDLDPLGDAIIEASRLHTVLMSEHRQRLVARAHHLIELGPGAGLDGGRIVYDGGVSGSSWTRPHRAAHAAARLLTRTKQAWLEMDGIFIHNVKNAHVRIPLGTMTCIAGVSGSGKSSFVRGALVPAVAARLPPGSMDVADFRTRQGQWSRVSGVEKISALYALDQSVAPAQRRSLVATFLDVAEPIRVAFAKDPVARRLGLEPRDFGTNSGKGRCQRCLGIGLLDDGRECPVCGGLRFGADVLSVRIGGLNIAELFATPVGFLMTRSLPPALVPSILKSLVELGIEHLSLGRSLDTLSGGEVQRLRIARALERHASDGSMFVLDEPAGGLHPRDVERLEKALRHIVADGVNTVILVEHDPYLLGVCDHIVEFGPGSGPAGGQIVSAGTPAELRGMETPTGRALRHEMAPKPAKRERSAAERVAFASTPAEAKRVRAEIRQIMGDDVAVPEDGDTTLRPAAMIDGRGLARRPYELGGLDQAILSILLDARRRNEEAATQALADAWDESPELHLQIHPFLEAMAIWGPRVPRSVIAETERHLRSMGLDALSATDDARVVRTTGRRLDPNVASKEGRKAAIRDAWALGGGYVELVDGRGRVRDKASDRLLDLDLGLVGPRHPAPDHFRRFDPRGRCPMCKGATEVETIDPKHFVGNRTGRVLDESSLDPRAVQVLKGVRRSDMIPFFRRLAEEGLWDSDARWNRLDPTAEALVMHGYWIRPGQGTFLRAGPKMDGSEVGHWLRWDGMVAALESQIDRSKDAKWREAVLASRHAVICPNCRGAGLGPAAGLLVLGKQPFDAWVREDTMASFLAAIDAIQDLSPRAARERERVTQILAAFRTTDARLSTPAPPVAARNAVAAAAEAFSGMPVVWE